MDKAQEVQAQKTTMSRCSECKKKLGLLGFECRCKKQFCAFHRAAEEHKCTFDFKAAAKNELLKYMSSPVIAEKISII